MYGSQQPPPPPPGSQPEWQSNTSFPPPPPPPPPPPLGTATYTPSTYGPMPGAQPQISPNSPSTSPALNTQFDTTSWGVRYNRQQQHHHSPSGPPPPLPPRTSHQSPPPPSYTPPSTSAPQGASWSEPPPPPPPRPGQHAQPWAQPASYDQTGQASHIEHPPPPPPPPRPPVLPAYQQENQQAAPAWQQTPITQSIPGPHYATGPPTHRYDPPQVHHRQDSPDLYGPSSPITTATTTQGQATPSSSHAELPASYPSSSTSLATPQSTVTTSAQGVSYTTSSSALGAGGPSDWEHFSPAHVPEDDQSSRKHENGVSTPTVTQSPIVQSPQTTTLPVRTQEPPSATAPTTPPSTNPPPRPAKVASPPRVENDPSSHQDATRPAPGRDDSLQSNSSIVSAEGYSEEIDKVISAWNQPISPKTQSKEDAGGRSPSPAAEKAPSAPSDEPPAKPPTSTAENSVASTPSTTETQKEHRQSQVSATADTPAKEPEAAKVEVKYLDPYEDLDPWFKSSLERYVTMLRKEAVADSDEEKYKIFTNFVAKETKLREVLYNVEPEEKKKPEPPATPPAPRETKPASPTPVIDSGLIPVESEEPRTPVEDGSHSSTEDGDDIAYSPGGRPILSRRPAAKKSPATRRPQRSASNPGTRPAQGPQGLLHSGTFASDPTARPVSVPPPITKPFTPQPQQMQPLISEPPQPAYTPFRYSEGPQRNADVLNAQGTAYQAYSALRQASAESGRAMANPAPPASQGPRGEFSGPIDETFLGIIREKSVSYRGKHPALLPGAGIEALGALIPNPFPKPESNSEILTVQREMEKFTDDFSYIKEEVDRWETSAKERRAKLEKARLEREQASEERIDGLFNDKEIGYADINKLEDEFRQSEARTQLEEERQELENFIRQVFNPLDKRIREEIVELRALLQRAMDDLTATARSPNGHAIWRRYQVSHTMKVILALSGKLEKRFQHRLDIALDRERRRKKAERRPLVYLGDSRALKTLDGDFEKMEKQNVVDAAKDRDHRANQLTDLFDEAILFALGGHQRLVDDILGKAKRLDGKAIERSSLSENDKELILRSISALVKGVVDDAESMLTSVKEADTMLNDADYSVSVAQARFSNASEDVYERLAEEKKKEDAKIEADFQAKMDSFKDGPAQITAKMDTLLKVMGKPPGPGAGPWKRPAAIAVEDPVPSIPEIETEHHPAETLMPGPRPTSASVAAANDPEQQERLRKALEEAKRRNAAKGLTA